MHITNCWCTLKKETFMDKLTAVLSFYTKTFNNRDWGNLHVLFDINIVFELDLNLPTGPIIVTGRDKFEALLRQYADALSARIRSASAQSTEDESVVAVDFISQLLHS